MDRLADFADRLADGQLLNATEQAELGLLLTHYLERTR